MTRRIISFLLCVLCLFNIQAQKYEYRATWLTTLGGMDWPRTRGAAAQKAELCTILDSLKSANINTVLFQTRLRSTLIYPSNIEPLTQGISKGYDALQFAIDECHRRGIELHAWIVTIPKAKGFLNPAKTSTATYLARIVHEITERYDVDGIHLDYIRYSQQTRSKTGSQQRRDNITNIVRAIYKEVKALKPWVKVSCAPLGKYKSTYRYSSKGWEAYGTVYQDACAWMQEGIMDVLFPMMYARGNNFYPFALDWKERCGNKPVVPGLGIYCMLPKEGNWSADEISRQIYFCRHIGLSGQAYFRNEFLMKDIKGLFSEVRKSYYQRPALVPPLPDAPQPVPLQQGRYSETDAGEITLSWQATQTDVVFHIYGSSIYPVDINNGKNLLYSSLHTNSFTFTPTDIERYYVVTAANRYGVESSPLPLNSPAHDDIPIVNNGNQLLISEGSIYDSNQQELMTCQDADLRSLPSGFYMVKKEGRIIGTIIK